MQVREQQLELDMEQQFQIGKGVCQGRILSPCLLVRVVIACTHTFVEIHQAIFL